MAHIFMLYDGDSLFSIIVTFLASPLEPVACDLHGHVTIMLLNNDMFAGPRSVLLCTRGLRVCRLTRSGKD